MKQWIAGYSGDLPWALMFPFIRGYPSMFLGTTARKSPNENPSICKEVKCGKPRLFGLLCFLVFISLYPQKAFAYLDGGTGSMILQIMLGGLAGLAMAGKLFWSQIKNFFWKLVPWKGRKPKNTQNKNTLLAPDEPDAGD